MNSYNIWTELEDGTTRRTEQYGLSIDTADDLAAAFRRAYPGRKYAVAPVGQEPAPEDYL